MIGASLLIHNVDAEYGRVQVLWSVSLYVKKGEIVCLLGPNGAGKTTLIKAIMGILSPSSGSIEFDGRCINGLPTHEIASLGVSYVPEGRELFPRMSTYENLLMGADRLSRNIEFVDELNEVYDLFPILKERLGQRADALSGGEQQMLAIARSLVCRPSLLILDEPSAGLAPKVVHQLFKALEVIRERGGTAILLAEQNAYRALKLSDRAYLLENGRIVEEGSGEEMLVNYKIKTAYFGL